MRFQKVSVFGVAHVDAPIKVASEEIEKRLAPTLQRLEMKPNLIRDLSGIIERRIWDDGVQPSDVAAQAAEKAIEQAGITRDQLGILVNTSVCRDYIEPSTASIAHSKIGLPETCMNFDLGNACLAFINGMDMVGNMIEQGQIDYGIVVNGESSKFSTEKTVEKLLGPDVDEETFRSNFATLTLGSGSAAMVLGRSDLAEGGHPFLGGVNLAATEHNNLCYGQVEGMVTKGHDLLVAGLGLAARTWKKAVDEFGWTIEDFDHCVLHQVSKVHTEQFCEIVGLDVESVFRLYPYFANIGPAGVPIVLSKLNEEGRIKSGDRIAVMGIGSGLNCTMAELRW